MVVVYACIDCISEILTIVILLFFFLARTTEYATSFAILPQQ